MNQKVPFFCLQKHQKERLQTQQTITHYLTRKPQHAALQLPKTTKTDFEKMLDEWYFRHGEYLNERSINAETGKTWYTHKHLRSAYRNLRNNLEWLFVYQEKTHKK